MHAFGGALRCLGSFSTSSLASSGLSVDSGRSMWPSFSSIGSGELAAMADLAAADANDCFTVDILEDSPSHAFLVRAVTNM